MDYLVIGSIGFAQLGQEDYETKAYVEDTVIRELINIDPNFNIPKEFEFISMLRLKKFTHDFGIYSELVLNYNDVYVSNFEKSLIESEYKKFEDFWAFANNLESYDFEQEILMEYCKRKLAEDDCVMYYDKEELVLKIKNLGDDEQ